MLLHTPAGRGDPVAGNTPGKDAPSIVDGSCQAPALSTVRTIKYPETTGHREAPALAMPLSVTTMTMAMKIVV